MTVRTSVAVGGVHVWLRWPKPIVPARSSQVANGVENSPAPVTMVATASLSDTSLTSTSAARAVRTPTGVSTSRPRRVSLTGPRPHPAASSRRGSRLVPFPTARGSAQGPPPSSRSVRRADDGVPVIDLRHVVHRSMTLLHKRRVVRIAGVKPEGPAGARLQLSRPDGRSIAEVTKLWGSPLTVGPKPVLTSPKERLPEPHGRCENSQGNSRYARRSGQDDRLPRALLPDADREDT